VIGRKVALMASAEQGGSGPFDRVLIAYDGSEQSRQAVRLTARLFPWVHAYVVHAVQLMRTDLTEAGHTAAAWGAAAPILELEDETAAAVTEEARHLARDLGLDAVVSIAHGSEAVWQLLVAEADRREADLIVMGTRRLHGLRELAVGSTSHAVIAHSSVPVLVVPEAVGRSSPA
jgi:nucleotide-binding universal stress UspA family protein